MANVLSLRLEEHRDAKADTDTNANSIEASASHPPLQNLRLRRSQDQVEQGDNVCAPSA